MTSPQPAVRPYQLRRALAVLFGAHALGLLVPLLTVPWLARQLGPTGWAPVLVAQALAGWAILVLEFGFDLAGTREVAQAESAADMALTAAKVQHARLLLTPLVGLGVLGTSYLLRLEWPLIVGTLCYVIARGFSPYWFFQGKQRIRAATTVDTLGKLLPAGAVFVFVQGAGDGWRVVALQAVGASLATLALTWRLHQQHALPAVSTSDAVSALRSASPMFFARAASGLYLQANTLILSVMAPAAAVAAFGGAERIVRAAINLLIPITQAVFPRLSMLAKSAPEQALRETRWLLVGLVSLAICGAAGAAILAAPIVHLLLGPSFDTSVPVMRLLVITIPLVSAGGVLGLYWALPWRHERLFLGAVLLGGVTNLVLASVWVPRWEAMGMAGAAVVAEACVATVLTVAFLRKTVSRR
ncbi:MAG: oligosaccharide flippase family protein [Gemmatimonadaceae bacterium]|nr:oligosaccharide flippase family protein [Gemmatimonadaceae bacterium]